MGLKKRERNKMREKKKQTEANFPYQQKMTSIFPYQQKMTSIFVDMEIYQHFGLALPS